MRRALRFQPSIFLKNGAGLTVLAAARRCRTVCRYLAEREARNAAKFGRLGSASRAVATALTAAVGMGTPFEKTFETKNRERSFSRPFPRSFWDDLASAATAAAAVA